MAGLVLVGGTQVDFTDMIKQMSQPELERFCREGRAIKEAHKNACANNAAGVQFGYLEDSLPATLCSRASA